MALFKAMARAVVWRKGAALALILLLPLVLLRGHLAPALQRLGYATISPVTAAWSYCASALGSSFERWVLHANMQDENIALRAEGRELRTELARLRALEQENEELRRALQLRSRVSADYVAVERVRVDMSPLFEVIGIRIDRSAPELATGMAVVAPAGVVGRIGRLLGRSSDVILLTDPRSRIAVEVSRVRALGILHGASSNRAYVDVSKDYAVVVGDVVQTSGVDELFPQGQVVGQVVEIEALLGGQQRLHVQPAARFDEVRLMWVVRPSSAALEGGSAT